MVLRPAYTEEVRRGNYTPDAIDTIKTNIKKHPKAALRIFELTWKGIIREGQLTGAVSFLNHLGGGLDKEDFDTILLSLRDIYGNIQETSWDAWAAAFTAADFLHEEYRNDDTLEMTRRIQHGAVSKRQQIMGQSTSIGQWSNAYLVLKRLQRHYKLEKHRARKKHREGKKGYNLRHLEAKHVERMKKSNDDLAEVLHATLNLAVQKHQWVEASHQVLELVELNADVHDLVRILEEICSGAISENRWQDATETVRAFKNILNYKKVAAKSLGRLRRQWYEADGIRWATGNAEEFHLSAYAKELRRGEIPYGDAANAIIKHIKDPNAALILFEATWHGSLGGSVRKLDSLMGDLYDKLDIQDYNTLLLLLNTMYDHVVLETSWAAWAGAIAAIEHIGEGPRDVAISCIRMEGWILDQFASKQREIIAQGVLEGQEHNAICVLITLKYYHHGHYRREKERHLEWNHLERKKKHINNLVEVLQALLPIHVQESQWAMACRAVAGLLRLESEEGRHADFHGGVECICDPSTCRHTAYANDLYGTLEEMCKNLIRGPEGARASAEAYRAISEFEHMPPCYNHIAKERHRRVRRMYIDRWGNPFDGSDGSEDESDDESDDERKDESKDESEDESEDESDDEIKDESEDDADL
ncbi:hypothetical protein ACLOAV_003634 [Pseudogymnoascus australis]